MWSKRSHSVKRAKGCRWIFAVVMVALGLILGLSAPNPGMGAGSEILGGTYACSTPEYLDTLDKAMAEGRYEPYFYEYMASSKCVAVEDKTPVTIIERDSGTGKTKIRIQGVNSDMWVASKSLAGK